MNFDFLNEIEDAEFGKPEKCGQLYGACSTAEAKIFSDPYVALREERSALECVMKYYHKKKNKQYLDSTNAIQKDEQFQKSLKDAIKKEIRKKQKKLQKEQSNNESTWKPMSEDEIKSEAEYLFRKIDESITDIRKYGDSGVHIHSVQNARFQAEKNLESLYNIIINLLNDLGLTNIAPAFVRPDEIFEKKELDIEDKPLYDYTDAIVEKISDNQYKISFPDSEKYYIGNVRFEKPDGKGMFHFSEKSFYEGAWKNGLPDGHGKMVYADGQVYDGEWKKGKRHGKGTLTSHKKSTGKSCVIIANFTEDSMNDENGEIIFEDGDRYVGGLKGSSYNGKGIYYREDGTIRAKGQWISGKAVGFFLCYYANGQISQKGNFVNGEWDGHRTDYFENGQIKFDGFFKAGKKCGYGKSFFENGNLMEEGTYENDQLSGEGKTYYKNGVLEYEGEFKNGKRNGFGKKYNKDGVLIYEGGYIDGKANGESKSYHDDGTLWHEGTRLNGYFDGQGKEYYKNGQLEYEGEFKNGHKEGYGILYNEAGWKEYIGEFKNGSKYGRGKLYTEDGWLLYTGFFKDGLINGDGIYNFEHGSIFSGEFKDHFWYKGTYYSSFVDYIYDGVVTNGLKQSGYGKVIYRDGRILEGYFKEDILNGYVKRIIDGKSYDEYWYQGEKLDEDKIATLELEDPFFKVFKVEKGLSFIKEKNYSYTTKEIIINICNYISNILYSFETREFLYKRVSNIKQQLEECLDEYADDVLSLKSDEDSDSSIRETIGNTIKLLDVYNMESQYEWGPKRLFYKERDYVVFPTINSLSDSNEIGDEKLFVQIRKHGEMDYTRGLFEIIPGEKYDIRIYYNNNVSSFEEVNGCAREVRVSTSFTQIIKNDKKGNVSAVISSENTDPQKVNCQRYIFTTYDKVLLCYEEGSARIHCNGAVDGTCIPDDLFTKDGAYIGYNNLDGRLMGGCNYAGYIEYSIISYNLAGSISQFVSFDGKEYEKQLTIIPNTKEVSFRIIVENKGNEEITNVCIKGFLSNGLMLIPGSVTITANDEITKTDYTDKLFESGIIFEVIAPHNTIYIYYRCKIAYEMIRGEALISFISLEYNNEINEIDQNKVVTLLYLSAPKLSIVNGEKLDRKTDIGTYPAPWGPERSTFTWDNPASYVTFNSIIDNPTLGDERSNFVRIREVNGMDSFKKEIEVFPDKVYEIYIYYNNGGALALSEINEIIAHDVRIRSSFPKIINEEKRYYVSATISSKNANPKEVWDSAHIISNEELLLKFVPNSIRLHSFSTTDSQILNPDEFFSPKGALISAYRDKTDNITSADEGRGYITYCFLAKRK